MRDDVSDFKIESHIEGKLQTKKLCFLLFGIWFSSYLIGRTNAVKIRSKVASAPVITQHGVPQGSVVGPLLFNIYFLPITDIFDRHQIRYHIYADDTQLYTECPSSSHANAQRKIEECVSDIRQWLDYNHLLLN